MLIYFTIAFSNKLDGIKFPFKPHVYKHDETWSMLITTNGTEQLLRNQEAE